MKKNERIKKTNIQKGLELINKDEKYLEVLKKFLQSPKGQEMVNCVDRRPIIALMREFGAPKASWRNKLQQYNLLKAAMKLAHVKPFFKDSHIVDYTHLLYDKQLKGELKQSKPLSHGEMKDLNKRMHWNIKCDNTGNPIIKTDSEGKKLYYKGSGNPVYKYTPKTIGIGLALRMHLLEEHKMAKWDRKNPPPSETDLKQDLFPEELISGHRTARYVHLENVREFLAVKYCKGIRKIPDLRVFEVYTNKFNNTVCEVERREDEYCLTGLDKNTSNITLKAKLGDHIKKKQFTPMGEQTLAYKIYDNSGNLRVNLKVA